MVYSGIPKIAHHFSHLSDKYEFQEYTVKTVQVKKGREFELFGKCSTLAAKNSSKGKLIMENMVKVSADLKSLHNDD